MKIAFVSDDGQTISAHFGRAQYYVVVSVEDGQEVGREMRHKPGHGHGQHHDHGDGHVHLHEPDDMHEHQHGHGHGHDHSAMLAPIADCAVVVAGGMGTPMYADIERSGKQAILPRETSIEAALAQYVSGTLESDTRRVHRPHHH